MNLELKQKKLFAGERLFLLKDNVTLVVINKSLKQSQEIMMDVVAFDPKSLGQFTLAKKSLISFLFFLSISLILYLTPLFDTALEMLSLMSFKSLLISATSIVTLISFIFFLVLTRYECIFVARHSRVPLAIFFHGLPNKKEFKHFIQTIKKKSEQRFISLGLSLQKQRAGELKTLRRIYEKGGMDAAQYDVAKQALLQFSDN